MPHELNCAEPSKNLSIRFMIQFGTQPQRRITLWRCPLFNVKK